MAENWDKSQIIK